MGGAEQVFAFAFVFVCVYFSMYLYDETGGERDGEKGGARGLDQIVMKDRGVGGGNCRQARVPPGWTPKWLLTHHIYQPPYYPPLVHFVFIFVFSLVSLAQHPDHQWDLLAPSGALVMMMVYYISGSGSGSNFFRF